MGDNSLIEELRAMTSIELYLNANFYCNHPSLLLKFDEYRDQISSSFNNILPLCASFKSLDSGLNGDQLVKEEATSNCENKKWSSFISILALATVTNRKIHSYYPDCGEQKFKLLFNCFVEPRPPLKSEGDDLHILFCFEGVVRSGETFRPNHFVPLIFGEYTGQKRKLTQHSHSAIQKKKYSDITFFFVKDNMHVVVCLHQFPYLLVLLMLVLVQAFLPLQSL